MHLRTSGILRERRRDDLAGRHRGRHPPRRNVPFQRLDELPEIPARFDGGADTGRDLAPQPLSRLIRTPARPRAGRFVPVAIALDAVPCVGYPGSVEGGARVDLDLPSRAAAREQAKCVSVLGRGPPSLALQIAIGLVDKREVGELDDSALDALQLVPRPGARSSTKMSVMAATAASD